MHAHHGAIRHFAPKRWALLSAVAIATLGAAFAVLLAQSGNATAGVASPAATVGFCGNVQLGALDGSGGGQTWCNGPLVESGLYQVYGYGEHSVCVEAAPWNGTRACSSGTNGVYSGEVPGLPETGVQYGTPFIQNNTNTVQHASGIYLTH
jgi:hypothetical protein